MDEKIQLQQQLNTLTEGLVQAQQIVPFAMPDTSTIIVSTIIFFLATWQFKKLLTIFNIPSSIMSGLAIFVSSYGVSALGGEIFDYISKLLYN